jgi:hypothetical protein
MIKQTNEEFKAYIEELLNDLKAEKMAKRLAEQKASENKPNNVAPMKSYYEQPRFNNQYEYLHFYDLDKSETENGAIYDDCKWRYHYCQEPSPWEKCWQEDYAD